MKIRAMARCSMDTCFDTANAIETRHPEAERNPTAPAEKVQDAGVCSASEGSDFLFDWVHGQTGFAWVR